MSILDYMIRIYNLLEIDEEPALVLAPFAYISRLHNLDQIKITQWNAH